MSESVEAAATASGEGEEFDPREPCEVEVQASSARKSSKHDRWFRGFVIAALLALVGAFATSLSAAIFRDTPTEVRRQKLVDQYMNTPNDQVGKRSQIADLIEKDLHGDDPALAEFMKEQREAIEKTREKLEEELKDPNTTPERVLEVRKALMGTPRLRGPEVEVSVSEWSAELQGESVAEVPGLPEVVMGHVRPVPIVSYSTKTNRIVDVSFSEALSEPAKSSEEGDNTDVLPETGADALESTLTSDEFQPGERALGPYERWNAGDLVDLGKDHT